MLWNCFYNLVEYYKTINKRLTSHLQRIIQSVQVSIPYELVSKVFIASSIFQTWNLKKSKLISPQALPLSQGIAVNQVYNPTLSWGCDCDLLKVYGQQTPLLNSFLQWSNFLSELSTDATLPQGQLILHKISHVNLTNTPVCLARKRFSEKICFVFTLWCYGKWKT